MLRSPRRPRRPLIAPVLGAVLLASALAGCGTADPAETAEPTPDATSAATPGATATTDPSATPEAPAPTPFEIACDALLTAEQVYAFNPNVGVAPDYEPEGSTILAVVDAGGTACGWTNQTSGELIEIAVAKPGDEPLEAAANTAAAARTAVPTYGTPPAVEGYFSSTGRGGTAEVITGPYWIVVESAALFEPGDAAPLIEAVMGNLPPA
ncbi:iron ABC transporter ATP-binding protein [Agromyces sp. MMS24-JH15]|uniref:iron ABC transporter ATP-binding protein n=1 Tax=Agromyces sp. MMS24-JH15 TaxID=3243765 RepID=UPI0037489DCF